MTSFIEETFSCAGKAALITGASSGFGEHFAYTLAKAGCRCLALLARRVDRLEALAASLKEQFPDMVVAAVACDVSKLTSITAAFNEAEKVTGRVFDVIVNNAGIGEIAKLFRVDEGFYDKTMNVNVKGCYFVAQEAARRLIEAKKEGSIINIASIYGLRVGVGHSVYATSKASLVQMTKAMAIELCQHKIRVNVINPGYFLTEINEDSFSKPQGKAYIQTFPMRRLGQIKELDGALLLLASDASRFMYGSSITVDGAHAVSSL